MNRIPILTLAFLIAISSFGFVVATHTEEDILGNDAIHIDFESPQPLLFEPTSPEGDYDATTMGTGSGTSLVKSSPPADMEGTQSWAVEKTSISSSTFVAVLDLGENFDACEVETGVFEFEYIIDTVSAVNSQLFVGFAADPLLLPTSGSSADGFGISFNQNTVPGNAISGFISSNTGTANGVTGVLTALDTKMTWRMQGIDCEEGSITFVEVESGNSVSIGIAGAGHTFEPLRYLVIGTPNASTATFKVWLDSITVPLGNAAAIGTPGSTASVAVSNLCGFDVDPSGTTAIARTDCADSEVRTWSAASLSGSATDETNCQRFEGVAAYSTHVSYFQCDSGDADDVVSLSIRSQTLGSPDKPPVCSGSGFCIENIDDEELAGAQDDHFDLQTIREWPFDYSKVTVDTFGPYDEISMAWAITTDTGRAGVMTYTMNDNLDDRSDIDTVAITPSATEPTQICAVQDSSDGQSYLYAGSDDSNVKGFAVNFNHNVGNVFDPTILEVDLVEVFPGTASTAAPQGVACGDGRFAILGQDKITLWNRGESTPYFTRTGLVNPPDKGIHMSLDGNWTAYVDQTTWYVMTNRDYTRTSDDAEFEAGDIVASNSIPSGTFREIKLHGAGSTLWVATQDNVAAYATLFESTGGEDVAYIPPDQQPGGIGGGDGDGDVSTQPGGAFGSRLFPNANPTRVMIIGTIATVMIFALAAWGLTGKRKDK